MKCDETKIFFILLHDETKIKWSFSIIFSCTKKNICYLFWIQPKQPKDPTRPNQS